MKKISLLALVASSVLLAGGFKIPEQSTNAVALGAANIAHNHENADAAYYNPAKMVFMENKNNLEIDVTYISLDKINYKGTYTDSTPTTFTTDESSEKENFLIPTLHYVSPALGDSGARVGLSIVSPGGLSKQWTGAQGIKKAEEFTLKTIEINPTAAFKINDKLGFAVGFRILYSSGIAKAIPSATIGATASQDMNGDSIDFGYNLALSYNPISNLETALTYRSKINMNLDGTADLQYDAPLPGPTLAKGTYAGGVTLPLPASLDLAVAYTFPSKTTLELVYERTYWSSYTNLDFNYTNTIAEAIFGSKKAKNWKDTNTFRVGLTQELQDLTLMAGYVYDNTPTPDKTIGFELPDSDSQAISLGARYKLNEQVELGLSGLYSMRESRTITTADSNDNGLVGEFTGGDVLIISAGLGYKF